ncbi:hypothetical protein [Aminipila sp.]|uniref:hypothetical protein n=1 Tax=Aminipila sp. TaxID=2060095 RepID=UPI0028A26DA8|nr:hypothetical protein [Aminipila sp.]
MRKIRFTSQKNKKMISKLVWIWGVSAIIYNMVLISKYFNEEKPWEFGSVLKENNTLLASLSVPFAICLAVKLIEFFIIRFNLGETVAKDKLVLSWLIEHFYISYKADQVVLKDETILLILQFILCIFGFFIQLKWYSIGMIGILLYLYLYISLNFQDIKNLLKKVYDL